MLTLIQQPAGLQGEGAPARRGPRSTSLTDAEAMRLRAALRHMRGLFGTWACLADAMGVPKTTLTNFVHGSHPTTTHGLALKAARVAGTTVERLLGRPVAADKCPHCGARRGAP
ncbi:transcriptional regulator [Sorangium sp. So ce1036]|uniref:transcriptional regulator n=1 Tax=Sorangium sp. So ce1036 TaxID=3133328 RepID=UPI003EFD7297